MVGERLAKSNLQVSPKKEESVGDHLLLCLLNPLIWFWIYNYFHSIIPQSANVLYIIYGPSYFYFLTIQISAALKFDTFSSTNCSHFVHRHLCTICIHEEKIKAYL